MPVLLQAVTRLVALKRLGVLLFVLLATLCATNTASAHERLQTKTRVRNFELAEHHSHGLSTTVKQRKPSWKSRYWCPNSHQIYSYKWRDPSGRDADVPSYLHWLVDADDAGYWQAGGDFFAGLASSATFGQSDRLIDATGLGRYGHKCSDARAVGLGVGIAAQLLEGVGTVKLLQGTRSAYAASAAAIPGEARALIPVVGEENAARWAVASRGLVESEARAALGLIGDAFDLRNEIKYGNDLGPTANQLFGDKGSWDAAISSFWNSLAGVE